MDIAALSTAMAQNKLMTDVSIAVLDMAMDKTLKLISDNLYTFHKRQLFYIKYIQNTTSFNAR